MLTVVYGWRTCTHCTGVTFCKRVGSGVWGGSLISGLPWVGVGVDRCVLCIRFYSRSVWEAIFPLLRTNTCLWAFVRVLRVCVLCERASCDGARWCVVGAMRWNVDDVRMMCGGMAVKVR